MLNFKDHAECLTVSGVSWIFRGTAQQNNSVLAFNLYDTLSLICRCDGDAPKNGAVFAISKGTIPTSMTFTATGLTLSNVGSLIWTDVDGIQAGFENFIIIPEATVPSGPMMTNAKYAHRFLNVGTLGASDAGTYHCSVAYLNSIGSPVSNFVNSGGLTVVVNTKSDQAGSTATRVNRFLAYSTAVLGASKLFL